MGGGEECLKMGGYRNEYENHHFTGTVMR